MRKHWGLMAMLVLSLAVIPAAAHAKGKGNKGGHDNNYSHEHHRGGDSVNISISLGDRQIIRDHLYSDYRRNCPPGLAKKRNGCMPPGQAKKYRVGYPLPDDVVFFPVAGDLLAHLSPVPRGYRYVQVDKDVLLIAEASKKVIDAVTLLSAVGN